MSYEEKHIGSDNSEKEVVQEVEHVDTRISDVSMTQDDAAEAKLRRKLDLHLLPYLWMMYFFASADRANVSVALTMNREQHHDLLSTAQLTPQQAALGVAVFYISYTCFEIPSNWIMTKVSPSKWLARICITWGAVCCAMAAINNAATFYALRFLLGLAEAGLWPGMALYLTKFYRKREITGRIGTYYFAAHTASIIGNFVSAAVQLIDGKGNLYGYKWLFVIFGVATVLGGIVVYIVLPDSPEKAKWLTEEEKALARYRVESEKQGLVHPGLKEIGVQLKHYETYLFGVLYLCPVVTSTAGQYYIPTLISQMGGGQFTSIQVSLLAIPAGVVGAITAIIVPRIADRFRLRSIPISLFFLITIVGFITLSFAGPTGGKYFGILVAGFGQGPLVPIVIGWAANTADGEKAVAARTANASTIAQFGVIFGTFLLYAGWPGDAPLYIKSNMVCAGLCGLGILCTLILRFTFQHLNRVIERDGETKEGVRMKYLL
ncbi:hypothetical protein BZG36_04322 [Bifiguratus adelaidae]|uniref:Major facilitator superfamily (MFS) profile domain-containing protein n=1 Tax=Bifiguratus adelaidae TaxID=1938954 RepID=A0A261XV13_9FUNG|nr:hypothetical protein BZG36_04322 [Bifiguratus adelaidae]